MGSRKGAALLGARATSAFKLFQGAGAITEKVERPPEDFCPDACNQECFAGEITLVNGVSAKYPSPYNVA